MKKLILLLCMFFIARLSYAAPIATIQYLTADVTVADLEANRVTMQTAINNADGSRLMNGTVTTAKLDANANPENRWNEGFNDFIYTGLLPPTSTSLSSTTTAGTAYIEGARVVKDATAHTYTASKHTYLDLSSNGTFTYQEVALNASAPSVTANSIRLARISTDATTVAVVRDDRVTGITLAAGSASSIADSDSDTKIQTEETTDEDKLRFDTGGTERLVVDSASIASTVPFYAPNGTAAVPSITFTNEADTGLYRSDTNKLGISAAGSARITIDDTSMTSTLPIYMPNGTQAAPSYTFTNSTGSGFYWDGSTVAFTNAGSVVAQFRSDSVIVSQGGFSPSGYGADKVINTASTGTGTTTTYIGTYTINTSVPSDERTKKNISSLDRGLTDLLKLNPKKFKFHKEYVNDGEKEHSGLIAQELQPIFPEAIIERSDGMLAIQYDRLIPLLIQSIKDLNAKVESLEARITALEATP